MQQPSRRSQKLDILANERIFIICKPGGNQSSRHKLPKPKTQLGLGRSLGCRGRGAYPS